MKKVIIFLATLFLTLGIAQAQDVYFAGNHNGAGKIWKNDTLVYSLSDSLSICIQTLQLTSDSNIFTAGYSHDSSFDFVQGRVWLNDSLVFSANDNTAIVALALNDSLWTAAGASENEWGNLVGLVWQNGETLYAFSDSTIFNRINALAIDTTNGDIYTGGASGDDGEWRATVWKNDTLFWNETTFAEVLAIAQDGSDVYAAGNQLHETEFEEQYWATLWQNDSIVFSIPSDDSEFDVIALYNGSIYLGGYNGDTLIIWQDGEVLYSHTYTEESKINALVVNELGVYYAGLFDGTATVWKDGEILYQPQDCENINGLVVLPTPPQPVFTITVESGNPDWGTVSGGGSYPFGDTIQIEAMPNLGYEFRCWNDDITDNPLNIVVTQDSTFVATFALSQYTINVVSDHPAWGSVTGGGIFHYGDTIQIAATANLGFKFVGWDDGNTDNPRTIIVTESQTFTAHFRIQQCIIKTEVTPEGSGTVNGGGTYDYGTTIHLTAHSTTGYIFDQWEDGNITNPRSVFVEGDATFVAVFTPLLYEITTSCSPENGGTVTGAGSYYYGTTATLTASANDGFIFICWSDGIVSNPRNVTVTGNATYTALFHQNGTPTYTITVISSDPDLGTVSGGGEYPEGATIEISATPAANAYFTGWDDGNTDNPRRIEVTQDMTFTANFAMVQNFIITVLSSNPFAGSVYGGGTYPVNTTINIGANANNGFHFVGWQDGNIDNPRSIVVTENAIYTASFAQTPVQSYTVTVYYDEAQGYVIGAGTYVEGSIATLAAIANDEYVFVKWSDNTTDNPKEVLVDHDLFLAAFFNGTGVDENADHAIGLYPNPANDKLYLEGLEGQNEIQIYNVFGMPVKSMSINGDDEIHIGDLAAGIYLIRINGCHSLKFVKR